jgi:hypothetical protein
VKLTSGLRYHSTRHVQPFDDVAGGRETALQLKHGDHAHRKQEVRYEISLNLQKTIDISLPNRQTKCNISF